MPENTGDPLLQIKDCARVGGFKIADFFSSAGHNAWAYNWLRSITSFANINKAGNVLVFGHGAKSLQDWHDRLTRYIYIYLNLNLSLYIYIYMYLNIYIYIHTSSTAHGSFTNRTPIGEVGCCESRMAERSRWWTEKWLRSPLFLSLSLTIYLPT